jgi:hypothetical protein
MTTLSSPFALAVTSSVLAFAFVGDFSRDATTRWFGFTTDRPASYCGKALAEPRPASKAALAVMAKRLSRLRK